MARGWDDPSTPDSRMRSKVNRDILVSEEEGEEDGVENFELGEDSFSVPMELFDLQDLGSVLSLEVWNNCLTEDDRLTLAEFLPSMDRDTFGLTLSELFSGQDDFFFGNPVATFFTRLRLGLFRSGAAAQRGAFLLLEKKNHYNFLREYHDSMVDCFVRMRDAWRQFDQKGLKDRVRFGNFIKQWRNSNPKRVFECSEDVNGECRSAKLKRKEILKAKKKNQGLLDIKGTVSVDIGKGFMEHGVGESLPYYSIKDVNEDDDNKVTIASYGSYPLKKKKAKLQLLEGKGGEEPKSLINITNGGRNHNDSKFASFGGFSAKVSRSSKKNKSKISSGHGEQGRENSSRNSGFSDRSKIPSGSSFEAGDVVSKPIFDDNRMIRNGFGRSEELSEYFEYDLLPTREESRPSSAMPVFKKEREKGSPTADARFCPPSVPKLLRHDHTGYAIDETNHGFVVNSKGKDAKLYAHLDKNLLSESVYLKSYQKGNFDGESGRMLNNYVDPNPSSSSKDVSDSCPGNNEAFIPITPTVHKGFLFSIIHLLSSVRNALITFNKWDGGDRLQELKEGEGQNGCQRLTIQDIVNRVRSNPGDPLLLETQEPLPDLVRGALRIFSSKTAPLGAKDWKPLVFYDNANKTWLWVGPTPWRRSSATAGRDTAGEDTSAEMWGVPHKMLVKLVDAFANWLKGVEETLQKIGSLPVPPLSIYPFLDERDRFREMKNQKNPYTIMPSSMEMRSYFHREEILRYSISDRAFFYTAADGRKSSVAPLRRGSGKPTSKARDHFMLKLDRPPQVTILCLVRDAVARLPGSIGTRADVSTLLRDSQFVVEDVPDSQVNQVVSGALDRLHYEKDPCVRFDNDRRLWVYLHRDREDEDFEDEGTLSMRRGKRQKKDNGESSIYDNNNNNENYESLAHCDMSPEFGGVDRIPPHAPGTFIGEEGARNRKQGDRRSFGSLRRLKRMMETSRLEQLGVDDFDEEPTFVEKGLLGY